MAPGDVNTMHPPNLASTVGQQIGIVSTSDNAMFDAAAHFGCNRTRIKGNANALSYAICQHKVAAVQTTAACSGLQTVPPVCDTHAPPVALANAKLTPIHLDGALYTRYAFWALPAALLPDSEAKLIWSLIVQRLLWLSGNQVVVRRCKTGLNPNQNSRLLSAANRLNDWNCWSTTMKQCFLDIIANNSGLVNDSLASSYGGWLDALDESGYRFPKFSHSFNEKCENLLLHAVDHSVPVSRVYTPISNFDNILATYKETCHRPGVTTPSNVAINFAKPWTQFNDILLVITFNNPHFDAIPYVETLYRPFFPNILYCGPGMIDLDRYAAVKKYKFSFLSYGINPSGYVKGAFTQKCMAMALQMGYDSINGYLTASDDVLMVLHTIAQLKKNALWFVPHVQVGELNKDLTECTKGKCGVRGPGWHRLNWWQMYKKSTTRTLAEIASRRNSSTVMNACYQRLVRENGAAHRANGAFSDIYYIPSNYSQDFIELSELFLHHNVLVEIAVPTIVKCLIPSADVEHLRGDERWGGDKMTPWKFIRSNNLGGKSYSHPVKWGFMARGASTQYNQLYCATVLPYLHDHKSATLKPSKT